MMKMMTRRTALSLTILILGIVLLTLMNSGVRERVADKVSKANVKVARLSNDDWTPDETVTGDILAANFAQGQRDWELADMYISKLGDVNQMDQLTRVRLMLLAIGSGRFDRATELANSVKTTAATAPAPAPDDAPAAASSFGDGQDLASLVIMAGDVRAGNY